MKIIDIPAGKAERLVPLLQDLHALHVAHQPARHVPDPDSAGLAAWIGEWLSGGSARAIGAESPQGALLGYAFYEIENRPALPVRPAETRLMLHQIAVAEPFRRMGIGKALMEELKARAKAAGVSVIAATYAPFNTASAGLMQGMGLEPVLTMAEWRG